MKQKLMDLYAKYGDILRYLVIGVLTTVIDIAFFALFNGVLGLHYQIAKVIAWVVAVAFAFWGNKKVVFRTKTENNTALLREAGSFLAMRLVTLAFSVVFLYGAVEIVGWDENISNIICNIVVIILNYILSKLVVFKKK